MFRYFQVFLSLSLAQLIFCTCLFAQPALPIAKISPNHPNVVKFRESAGAPVRTLNIPATTVLNSGDNAFYLNGGPGNAGYSMCRFNTTGSHFLVGSEGRYINLSTPINRPLFSAHCAARVDMTGSNVPLGLRLAASLSVYPDAIASSEILIDGRTVLSGVRNPKFPLGTFGQVILDGGPHSIEIITGAEHDLNLSPPHTPVIYLEGAGASVSIDPNVTHVAAIHDALPFITQSGDDFYVSATPGLLESATEQITGIAADGAAQLLIKVTSVNAGRVRVSFDEQSLTEVGKLSQVGISSFGQGTLQKMTVPVSGSSLHAAYFVYLAPKNFSRTSADDVEDFRLVNLKVEYSSDGNTWVNYPLQIVVVRPPVALVHGLWSDSETWGGKFKSLVDGSDSRFDVSALNYKSYNSLCLPTIEQEVQKQFEKVIKKFRSSGYAVAKADWIGHSMGGLLAREYFRARHDNRGFSWNRKENYGAGDIHKLILINSPQAGSPLADILNVATKIPFMGQLIKLGFRVANKPIGCAITDLGEGSLALSRLGETKLPSFSVIGTGVESFYSPVNSWLETRKAVQQNTPFYNIVFDIAAAIESTIPPALVYRNQKHDLLVLEDSQQAGLSANHYTTFADNSYRYGHTAVTSNDDYYDEVIRLLNAPVSSFASSLPKPNLQPRFKFELSSSTNITNDIQFVNPSPSTPVEPDDQFVAEVQGINGFVPTEVTIYMGDTSQRLSSPPFKASFSVPDDAIGEVELVATASDANGKWAISKIHSVPVTMKPGVTLQSIEVRQSNLSFTTPLEKTQLQVEGMYSDNTLRDLTKASSGTSYGWWPPTQPFAVTVDKDGLVTAHRSGIGRVNVYNNGISTTVPYIVNFKPVTNYGVTVPGTGDISPRISTGGETPKAGNQSFVIEIEKVRGQASGYLLLGFAPAEVPVPELGGELYVDLSQGSLFPIQVDGESGKGGDGKYTYSIPIPNNQSLIGKRMFAQGAFIDPDAPKNVSFTNGLFIKIVP